MTEDEAKKKTCPMSFSGGTPSRYPIAAPCLGADCMAWRDRYMTPRPTHSYSSNDHGFYTTATETIEIKYDGYCGLAGKPE
jgi:hypothetical protein